MQGTGLMSSVKNCIMKASPYTHHGPFIMFEDDLWHILVWPGPFTVEIEPISKKLLKCP